MKATDKRSAAAKARRCARKAARRLKGALATTGTRRVPPAIVKHIMGEWRL